MTVKELIERVIDVFALPAPVTAYLIGIPVVAAFAVIDGGQDAWAYFGCYCIPAMLFAFLVMLDAMD